MLHLHLACFLFSQTMRAHSLDLVEASGSDNVFFDASTSVSRSESQIECALDVATCVRPTHGIYSVRLGRYLHAEELLACQGIWRIDSENMQVWDAMVKREKFAQNMAGNSFSATVCQANFLTCLIACDGWRELQPATPGTAATGNAKRHKIDCRQDVGDTAGTPSAAAGTSKSQPLLEKREDAKKTACLSGSQTIPTRRLRRKTTLVPVPRPKKPNGKGAGNTSAIGKKVCASIWEKEAICRTYEEAVARGDKKTHECHQRDARLLPFMHGNSQMGA